METSSGRTLFLIAAAFNLIVALSLVLPGDATWRLVGMTRPESTLFLHLFLTFVALFGLAYLWIGLDPSGKHALIVIGVIGKLSAFAVIFAHWVGGSVPGTVATLGTGDLVFAGLFLRYLQST